MHSQHDINDDVTAGVDYDYNSETGSESGVFNPASILLEIRKDSKFDGLSKSVNQLKVENRKLKDQNDKLETKVSTLTDKLQSVETTLSDHVKKQEKLETFSRKNNLKFYDIDDSKNETPEESQRKVFDFVKTTLEIDTTDIPIERAHRIPTRFGNIPIIMQFTHYKHRELILKAFRQKRKMTQLQVRIGEDFPERVSKARTGLYQLMKDSVEQGKTAFFKSDKLVVDGDYFMFDFEQKKPIHVPK